MVPEYFDIHSHLNFPDYDQDREEVIKKLKDSKVFTITVGTELKTSTEAVELADAHEHVFATIGVHPADDHKELFSEPEFSVLAAHPKVVAIGECGLDYFRLAGDVETMKKWQKDTFEQQIEFAVKHDKPLMIHCRDAYPDVLAILKSKQQEHGEKVRGNFHFFTSPIEIAKSCLEIGFTLSFTGPITYSSQYDELVAFVPIERMMAETDAPFAAPVPYRGRRNEPVYVAEVVKKISQIKALAIDEVRKIMVQNAFELFLKKPLS